MYMQSTVIISVILTPVEGNGIYNVHYCNVYQYMASCRFMQLEFGTYNSPLVEMDELFLKWNCTSIDLKDLSLIVTVVFHVIPQENMNVLTGMEKHF